jgi:cytochrome c biogenesis protein CcmG/thiol:disulfide interchange protein DsbE
MKRWAYLLPVLLLLGIGIFAGRQMLSPQKAEFARVSRAAPQHVFPLMTGGEISFAAAPGETPIAVNLFASWCGPCELEHPYLIDIGSAHPGQLYGVLYRDSEENGRAFLERLGDPFTAIALDPQGRGGLDFGLTGVPETFVISPEGEILLHISGPLDAASTKKVSGALTAPRS